MQKLLCEEKVKQPNNSAQQIKNTFLQTHNMVQSTPTFGLATFGFALLTSQLHFRPPLYDREIPAKLNKIDLIAGPTRKDYLS